MKDQIIRVLVYLCVVKIIDLLMKSCIEPQLEKFGMEKRTRECVGLLVEILAILGGLYLIKK